MSFFLKLSIATILITCYFTYHAVNGSRGLFALRGLEKTLAEKEMVLADLNSEVGLLKHKIKLLDPTHIDPDFLDELARKSLGVAAEDEFVIILKK